MLSLFANPFAMIAGALLISSPIIIHLINRMRFKRVRWAAMEFLLKAQQKSRRKMIIEQLILLLLRILLVLLVGFLLARFIGCDSAGREGQNTYHVILIDDTLSTGDVIRAGDGNSRTVYEEAKKLVTDRIADSISKANSPQYVTVVRLSELDNPRKFDRVNSIAIEEMRSYLAPQKPSLLHIDTVQGLKKVKELFADEKNMKPVLHVVADFRSADWGESKKQDLTQTFEELKQAGVTVQLLDCVTPERSAQSKSPVANDNLSIIELAPESKIVAKFQPIEFTVKIRNHSNSEKKSVNVHVRVNGVERQEGLINLASLPPNSDTIGKFVLSFDRVSTETGDNEAEKEKSALDGFNIVSAHLDNEPTGLNEDNVRYTVVDVRNQVPILMIDNNPRDRGTPQGETYFLQTLFGENLRGYDIQIKNVNDLDTLNLQSYVSIFICDVPKFTPAAVANLETYVRNGGGVAFFMGPSIKSDSVAEYNDKLYRDGTGVFPVPLEKIVGVDIPDAERSKIKLLRILGDNFSKKLLVQREMQAHPAMERLYRDNRGQVLREDEYERFFNFVVIDRYVGVRKQVKSKPGTTPAPKDDKLAANKPGTQGVDTLVYLQNVGKMDEYASAIIGNAGEQGLLDKLPVDDPDATDYAATLKRYKTDIRNIAASTAQLYVLAAELDKLLTDTGDQNANPKRANLRELWSKAKFAPIREEIERLRDSVKYGDPLYMAKTYGKGRVVAFMTSAGQSWNDLEGFGKAYYPPLMINMLNYTASAGTDVNLVLGNGFENTVDAKLFGPLVKGWQFTEDARNNKIEMKSLGDTNLKEAKETDTQALATFTFEKGTSPGVYAFKFMERKVDNGRIVEGQFRPDYRVVTYNLDAVAEGNLARANSDDVSAIAGGAKLFNSNSDDYFDSLQAKRRDLSENPWLYFIMLVVLILEQLMSVRLSFHSKPNEDLGPSPVKNLVPQPAA